MSRLINADKLKKDILSLQDCYNGFSDTYDKACIIGVIDEQPTIEERKPGKWILMSDADGKYYACSVCGNELQRYSTEPPTWEKPYPHKQSIDKTDFCPNCGAKMEG